MKAAYRKSLLSALSGQPSFFDATLVCILRAPEKLHNESRAMRYLLVTILALSVTAFAQTDEQRAAIADRIKSFSNVCVAGQDCGGASVANAAVVSLPGEAKYVGCAACHGSNGAGGIGPALAGRQADYIVGRLTAYRANEVVGAQSALMWGQAAALSDDDIQDLAEYVTSF